MAEPTGTTAASAQITNPYKKRRHSDGTATVEAQQASTAAAIQPKTKKTTVSALVSEIRNITANILPKVNKEDGLLYMVSRRPGQVGRTPASDTKAIQANAEAQWLANSFPSEPFCMLSSAHVVARRARGEQGIWTSEAKKWP